jgi:hypothetical protein
MTALLDRVAPLAADLAQHLAEPSAAQAFHGVAGLAVVLESVGARAVAEGCDNPTCNLHAQLVASLANSLDDIDLDRAAGSTIVAIFDQAVHLQNVLLELMPAAGNA